MFAAVVGAALNDTLKAEVQRLKVATGQGPANGGGGMMMNFGAVPRSFGGGNQQMFHSSQSQAMQSMLATHQLQQLQLHSQPQQLQAQHLQQVARDLKMKGHLGGQGQWGDGKSGSGSRSSGS